MLDSEVFEFIERCGNCRDRKQLLDDLLGIAGKFGFTHLILSGVPVHGRALTATVELNGWPAGWSERYLEKNYAEVDGVRLYSMAARNPFFWNEVPGKFMNAEASRRVLCEAGDFAMRSGFVVPISSMNYWRSVISFASPEERVDISARERTQLATIAIFAGAAAEGLKTGEVPGPCLSAREREVLLWAAEGKSAWETGEILGISEVTVKKHLLNIRRRMGVATTMQAVVDAFRRRIITPQTNIRSN